MQWTFDFQFISKKLQVNWVKMVNYNIVLALIVV